MFWKEAIPLSLRATIKLYGSYPEALITTRISSAWLVEEVRMLPL